MKIFRTCDDPVLVHEIKGAGDGRRGGWDPLYSGVAAATSFNEQLICPVSCVALQMKWETFFSNIQLLLSRNKWKFHFI